MDRTEQSESRRPTSVGGAARRTRSRRLLVFLFLVAALWFGGLGLRGLFIPDEGRYAEIPREMLASGDWVTPRLNGLKYFEKPPLQYWMTAAVFAVFGEDEWTARLWSALAGFAGVIVVLATGVRLWSWRVGVLSATVLASCWGYFLAGQYLTLDMSLSFFLTCALCSFLRAQERSLSAGAARGWMLAAWASMALAVLSKGLIGVVLPVLALAAHLMLTRDFGLLRRLGLVSGGGLFLAITLPWFLLVQARNPEFFQFFFIHEHFQRFAEAGHHRPGPWWYFLPVVVIGSLPWTLGMAQGLAGLSDPSAEGPAWLISRERFLAVWAATVLIFFSLSRSKLPAYVLPLFPALALLAGRQLARNTAAAARLAAATVAVAGVALAAALPQIARVPKFATIAQQVHDGLPWLYAGAALLAGAGVAGWIVQRRAPRLAMAVLALASLGFWQLAFAFLHQIDDQFSSERAIESLTAERRPFRPEVPFYSVAMFDHSVPFYLGRTVRLVAEKNELGPGIAAEPEKYVDSIAAFEAEWASLPEAFAIMPPAVYASLAAHGLPMRVLIRDALRVIVARR